MLELEHGRAKAAYWTGGLEPVAGGIGEGDETPNEAVVVAEDVRKTYTRGREQVVALDGVTVALHRGRLAALLGRSGSGKTALLNVLFGWESADAGSVRRLGEEAERRGGEPGRQDLALPRSEGRRGGEEGRSRWSPDH